VFAVSLSPTWRGMVSAISLHHSIVAPLQSNVRFKVGDGRNIRLWSDSWLGYATPLQFMFPRLYNLSLQQSSSIAKVHNPTDNSINLSWRRPLRSRELCMWESLIAEVERGLVFSDGEDKIWKSHSSNVYSVSLGCHLLDGFIVSTNLHSPDLLWKGFAPLKIDVFIWLLNGSICTKGFLAKRRIINYKEALCPFCCKEIETIHHLFHLCPTSWSL